MNLSILITVYSETHSLNETVDRLLRKDRNYIHEIILSVSPRSNDICLETCKQLQDKYDFVKFHLQVNNPGVGWAIREGIDLFSGDYLAIMSADLETEPEAIDRMVQKIESTGCDGVIGNRWMKGGGFKNYDSFKWILNYIFNNFFRLLYRTRLGDMTYGFKILKREIVKELNWEGTLHEIFIETTVRPIKRGYFLEQVPTIWIGRKEDVSKNTFTKNFRYVKLAFSVLFSN